MTMDDEIISIRQQIGNLKMRLKDLYTENIDDNDEEIFQNEERFVALADFPRVRRQIMYKNISTTMSLLEIAEELMRGN